MLAWNFKCQFSFELKHWWVFIVPSFFFSFRLKVGYKLFTIWLSMTFTWLKILFENFKLLYKFLFYSFVQAIIRSHWNNTGKKCFLNFLLLLYYFLYVAPKSMCGFCGYCLAFGKKKCIACESQFLAIMSDCLTSIGYNCTRLRFENMNYFALFQTTHTLYIQTHSYSLLYAIKRKAMFCLKSIKFL